MREASADREPVLERFVSRYDYAKEFLAKMQEGEATGLAKYGPFNPRTDRRTLTVEAQQEQRDTAVYMDFLKRKHPELAEEATAIKQMAFKVYVALRQLEIEERRLSGTSQGVSATGS